MNWMDSITEVEMPDERLNQIGKTHRCVRGKEGIAVMTTEINITDTTMELWETDLKKISACRYLLSRAPGGKTDLTVEFFAPTSASCARRPTDEPRPPWVGVTASGASGRCFVDLLSLMELSHPDRV
jgi:hypothetical protein